MCEIFPTIGGIVLLGGERRPQLTYRSFHMTARLIVSAAEWSWQDSGGLWLNSFSCTTHFSIGTASGAVHNEPWLYGPYVIQEWLQTFLIAIWAIINYHPRSQKVLFFPFFGWFFHNEEISFNREVERKLPLICRTRATSFPRMRIVCSATKQVRRIATFYISYPQPSDEHSSRGTFSTHGPNRSVFVLGSCEMV